MYFSLPSEEILRFHTRMTLQQTLQAELQTALLSVLEDPSQLPEGFQIPVTTTNDLQFGDYQSNIAMMLGKRLKMNPRDFAQKLVDALADSPVASAEIAGPGFLNFRIKNEAWCAQALHIANDDRLGVPVLETPQTIVVDFSGPNVAKPMHIGHIRSTIIGDSLSKVASFLGHKVIRDNHIGDWGTQFGMIVYGWKNFLNADDLEKDPLAELLRVYKKINDASKEDPALKELCKEELVKLQSGDAENQGIWEKCVEVSKLGLQRIYDRLDIEFDYWLGESAYNDQLAPLVQNLQDSGIARESDGAICVFSSETVKPKNDPFKINRDGEWLDFPFMVQKSDGGFGYATTDIATVQYREKEFQPDQVWYVVDSRQSDHFRQLFDVAERLEVKTDLKHIAFGTILGDDRKPFKTRSGETPQLADVLQESVERAAAAIEEKNPGLSDEEKTEISEIVGIGAVKFAELSQHRASDYIFSWEKLLALQGDTAPYLQYSAVRVKSIFRKLEEKSISYTAPEALQLEAKEEIHLVRLLSQFGESLPNVLNDCRPNLLASYLLELARAFHSFFEACPVLKDGVDPAVRDSRLLLCETTVKVLGKGLGLLGIQVPERM